MRSNGWPELIEPSDRFVGTYILVELRTSHASKPQADFLIAFGTNYELYRPVKPVRLWQAFRKTDTMLVVRMDAKALDGRARSYFEVQRISVTSEKLHWTYNKLR